jgi:HD-GYP domain-containing protein (c-di-GMP phosphodiesterase class II)
MIRVSTNSLKEGMKVAKPVTNVDGKLLIGRGTPLSEPHIRRLRDLDILSLMIDLDNTDDIIPYENIPEILRGSTIHHLNELFQSIAEINKGLINQPEKIILDTISSSQFIDTFRNLPAIEKVFNDINFILDALISGEIVIGLRSIRKDENYKAQHLIDVAIFAILLGRRIGFPTKVLRELGIGSLMHDIGEIFINDDILDKSDKLTSEEFSQVKNHSIIGFELIRNLPNVSILSAHVAFQHHEKEDGTGYPRGLRRNKQISISNDPRSIHRYGSIAAIAEVYDSLSSDRPFRKAFPPEKVITMMKEMSENYLNREILNKFFTIAPLYPEGTNIRIISNTKHNNYSGVVAGINADDSNRPIIRLLFNQDNEIIDPIEINLVNIDKEDVKIEPIP